MLLPIVDEHSFQGQFRIQGTLQSKKPLTQLQ